MMKTIKVIFDESLLAKLDRTPEVREQGRAAVLNSLDRSRAHEIDAQYHRAYTGVQAPLGREFAGWKEEGKWPPE